MAGAILSHVCRGRSDGAKLAPTAGAEPTPSARATLRQLGNRFNDGASDQD